MTSSKALVGDTFFGLDLKKAKAHFSAFRRRISKRILLIDFDSESITLAEAQIHTGALTLNHVRRYSLPDEALERGVPAEPSKMAALIGGFCEEMDIPAHRAAVVLSHDAVYTTIVKLPSSVPPDEALKFALDPASAVQVPVQLEQMDVDLMPLSLPIEQGVRSYFLTAVPRKLVDRILETLQISQFELVTLQVGVFAQVQHLTNTLLDLQVGAALLHLEFLRDCTQATLLCKSGPAKISRLTSIRNFPDPPEQRADSTTFSVLNAETQIIASDAYMPLSDLDLRRLVQEIHQWLEECQTIYPSLAVKSIVIAGVNSAHPQLASLLQAALALPVVVSRPLATKGVGQFTTSDGPIVLQSVGRLVGLGLSLLPESEDKPPTEDLALEPWPAQSSREVAPSESVQDFDESRSLAIPAHIPSFDEEDIEDQELSANVQPLNILETGHTVPDAETPKEYESLNFSFSLPEADALIAPDSTVPSTDNNVVIENVPDAIQPESVDDSIPFSLDELLSSYAAKTAEPEARLESQPISEDEDAEAYLMDDPSLWPSVAKAKLAPSSNEDDLSDQSE